MAKPHSRERPERRVRQEPQHLAVIPSLSLLRWRIFRQPIDYRHPFTLSQEFCCLREVGEDEQSRHSIRIAGMPSAQRLVIGKTW